MSIKLSALLATVLLAACATRPPQLVPAAAPPTTHAKAIVGGLAAVPPEQQAKVNQDLIKHGYRARLNRGQIVYCRVEPVTGSRFESLNCQSEEQLQRVEQDVSSWQMHSTGGPRCGQVSEPNC
jgi:hypothetical protein